MHMPHHSTLGADPARIAGAHVDRGIVRRVGGLARPYRALLVAFVGTIVVEAVLDLAPPLLFRRIIDDALPPPGDRQLLNQLALAIVVVAVASALFSFLERWYSARIGEGVIFDLRSRLFDHVQRLPITFFTRSQTGALVSRMNNDVIGAQRALTTTLGSVVSNVIVLTTTLVAMLLLEWRLTLIALVVLPIFIIPAKRVGRRMQRLTREAMNLDADMNARMTERFGVSGAMLVKLFGNHDREAAEFSDKAARVRDIGVRTALYGRTFFIALGLVAAFGTATVYWLGGQLVISDVITLGTLVALAAYVTRIYQPLTALTNARVDVMTAFVSFDRVFEVLDAPNDLPDRPGAVDLLEPRGHIRFDHVGFRYPTTHGAFVASLELPAGGDDPTATTDGAARGNGSSPDGSRPEEASPWVLDDVDLDIAPGSLVALVGPSGAGKTTLASLVPRLYDVTTGAVLVDGYDVRGLTQESLRAAIGVVSQDPHLFHETVRENLRYARPDATDDEVVAACRTARIAEVIEALPRGYDTVVGERGYRLSGGEKQRLAIARMILKDPAIVILDEATSHLDAENEALVQQALADALVDRTSLVIAHRLSTITAADQILVLDRGRIVESGTHAELLDAGALYADLYRTLVRAEPRPAGTPSSP